MTISEITAFLAVIECGSFSKAAEMLFITQPALSRRIQSLENEIGYKIIYRNHQGVQFIDKGKQVLMIAHNMVKEKEN